MSLPALELYGRGLEEVARDPRAADYRAVGDDGTRRRLPLARWLGRPALEELQVLDRALPAVLDVGCGAGRHLAELGRIGITAMGIDVSPLAAALARRRGGEVLQASVFDSIPDFGRWGSALLLDGNIGIGGDPPRLLRRLSCTIRPGGSVLVELEPPKEPTRVVRLRIEARATSSECFPWAWVGVDDVEELGAQGGLDVAEVWSGRGRWFADLRRPLR